MMRTIGLVIAGLAALCVLGGLTGHLHPAFDSLGIAMPYAGLGLLALAALLRLGPVPRLAIGAIGVAGLLPVAAAAIGSDPEGRNTLRLLQHNLSIENDAPGLPARVAGHDVVTLQEVQGAASDLADLPAEWVLRTCGGTAIASRLQRLSDGCLNDGHAWMQVAAPGGPVTVLSLHLHWPWPARGDRQSRQIVRLVPAIRALPRPLVVAGDFNQMPWSDAVARVARAADADVAPGLRVTLSLMDGLAPLPIDHVLIPRNWTAEVERAGRHGSDHVALSARLLRPAS
ncbi:endonuclease/exonuclease/phosphatase family protein [Jannaschia sp. S6380]|uniref:endonuclease/exonuclease/phosphatase family protein n=1 Tax=Jannaschia sp. S6380 TaxID=2926408 RepID=UPI001FF63EA8|nr:endonuclease/exonuclease/phosphatase family protein [Jannaschia sp. S6380]MCK0167092.1 endonuclease/exonuclease/phosphatase family protein [Jannaschia sp. S6380]